MKYFFQVFVSVLCLILVKCSSIPSSRVLPGSQLVTDKDFVSRFIGPTRFTIDHNEQVNKNSPAVDAAFAVENVCGVTLNFESSDNRNLRNFCHDSFKPRKDVGNKYLNEDLSDEVRKCYSFLCAWYQEKCDETMNDGKNQYYPIELVTNGKEKCNCLYNLWSQCRCDVILNVKEHHFMSQLSNNGALNIRTRNTNTHIDMSIGHHIERKASTYNIPPTHKINPDQSLDSSDNIHTRMYADEPDSFVFVDDGDEVRPWDRPAADPFNVNTYNEDHRKCFALKQVWYNNQCVKLKSETPCNPGEWLVLKKPEDENSLTELQPECQVKKCTKKDEVWWPSENKCVTKSGATRNYCQGKDVLVDHDSFGEGYCTCYGDSGSFEDNNDCYEFYQKGPCRITEVVTYNNETGYAACSKDLCFELNNPTRNRARRNKATEEDAGITKREVSLTPEDLQGARKFGVDFAAPENDYLLQKLPDPFIPELDEELSRYDRFKRQTNKRKPSASEKKYYAPIGGHGQCYKFGDRAICDYLGEDARFKFHEVLKVPDCFVSTSNALHLIDSRPGCKVDETNNCRQEVKLAQTSELDFLLHLKNQARKKRDTRPK